MKSLQFEALMVSLMTDTFWSVGANSHSRPRVAERARGLHAQSRACLGGSRFRAVGLDVWRRCRGLRASCLGASPPIPDRGQLRLLATNPYCSTKQSHSSTATSVHYKLTKKAINQLQVRANVVNAAVWLTGPAGLNFSVPWSHEGGPLQFTTKDARVKLKRLYPQM